MSGHGDKILVLDDELNFAEMLHELLVENAYDAEIATSPTEALVRLEQEPFTLVVADYKMPEMNGAEFLERIRSLMPELPVIMVSGLMNTKDLMRVANIGVTMVLEKPIDTGDFLDQVRRFVEPRSDREPDDDLTSPGAGGSRQMVSYPKPLAYFSDASGLSGLFTQTVWDAVQTHHHLVLSLPPGSELNLIARELCRWQIGTGGMPVCSMTVAEGLSASGRQTLQKIAVDADYAPVICIQIEDGPTAIAHLVEFISFANSDPALREGPQFLYALFGTGRRVGALPPEITGAYPLIFPYFIPLAPLCDRTADLAVYFQRLVREKIPEAPRAVRLDENAVRMVLAYDWPDNHRELGYFISHLETPLPDVLSAGVIQRSMRALRRESVPPVFQHEAVLPRFLLRKQRQYLERLGGDAAERRRLARAASIEPARLLANVALSQQPLLYPELLDDLGSPVAH